MVQVRNCSSDVFDAGSELWRRWPICEGRRFNSAAETLEQCRLLWSVHIIICFYGCSPVLFRKHFHPITLQFYILSTYNCQNRITRRVVITIIRNGDCNLTSRVPCFFHVVLSIPTATLFFCERLNKNGTSVLKLNSKHVRCGPCDRNELNKNCGQVENG
jgi:hypothetical protein